MQKSVNVKEIVHSFTVTIRKFNQLFPSLCTGMQNEQTAAKNECNKENRKS